MAAVLTAPSWLAAQSPFIPAQIVHRIVPENYMVSTNDFDGDSDDDVVVVSGNSGGLSWYVSLGSGEFSPRRTILPGSGGISALASGGLDDDDVADVVFASTGPNVLQVLLNNGDGSAFAQSSELPVNGNVRSIVLVDLDLDTDRDLAWTLSGSGVIEASFNDGSGVFVETISIGELAGGELLRAADIDGDGDPDLVCSSSVSGDISVLTNNGSGVFAMAGSIGAALASPWWYDVADMRADGDPDIIAPGGGATWFENISGAGDFVARTILGATSTENRMFAADVSGNSQPELLFTQTGTFGQCEVRPITIGPDAQYAISSPMTISCWGEAPAAFSDMDGDDSPDLIKFGGFNRIMWSSLTGPTFGLERTLEGVAFNVLHNIRVADVDVDGDTDIVSSSLGSRVVWFENDGTGTFTLRTSSYWDQDGQSSIELADIDGDGDPDFAMRDFSDGDILWARNDGQDGFHFVGLVSEVEEWTADFAFEDLDSDGDQDLVVSPPSNVVTSELSWRENLGDSQFSSPHVVTTDAPNTANLELMDMNADGLMDIVCPMYYLPTGILVFQASAPGVFPVIPDTTFGPSTSGTMQYANPGDLDGNGSIDLIASFPGELVPFLNDGSGSLSMGTSIPFTEQSFGKMMVTGDFDGDTHIDLIVGVSDCACLWYYPGIGGAEFDDRILVDSTGYGGAFCLQTADLDLDGDLDLVTARQNPTEIVWYENGQIAAAILESATGSMGITPNPMRDRATLALPTSMELPVKLEIMDCKGRVVRAWTLRSLTTGMERDQLPAGLYLVRGSDPNGRTTSGKLLVE